MKKIKILSLLQFAVYSISRIAAEKDYKICSIGGFFSGSGEMFLSGLALHIRVKQIDLDEPICAAAWKNATGIGLYFSSTGKFRNQTDHTVGSQAATFKSQVYDTVISNMDYK